MCCCSLIKYIKDEGSSITNSHISTKNLFQVAQLPRISRGQKFYVRRRVAFLMQQFDFKNNNESWNSCQTESGKQKRERI